MHYQDEWTLEELNALWFALAVHVFIKDILNAPNIIIHRKDYASYEGDGVAGATTQDEEGNYHVTIYDAAYYAKPSGFYDFEGGPSMLNFTSAIVHELTHVAVGVNPFILETYKKRKPFWYRYFPNFPLSVWLSCFLNGCAPEAISIAAAKFSLTTDLTGWQAEWMQVFYSPNPFVKIDYGPTYYFSPK